MNLVNVAINILWLLIGVIILLGIVYLALLVVKTFIAVPALVERAIWLVVLLLILIGALSVVAGQGTVRSPFRSGVPGPTDFVSPVQTAGNLQGLLSAYIPTKGRIDAV